MATIRQMQYTFARGHDAADDIISGLCSLYIAAEAVSSFAKIPFSPANQRAEPLARGLIYSTGAAVVAVQAINRYRLRKRLSAERRKITDSPVSTIFIADQNGLDAILERTSAKENCEWGVVYKVEVRMGYLAVIHSMVSPQECEARGFLRPLGRGSLVVNSTIIENNGYSGHHHYHPGRGKLAGLHYCVHKADRVGTEGSLHLLSFNTPEGPELIGFNHQDTFLPTNQSKDELVRATPREIWEYLGKKIVRD